MKKIIAIMGPTGAGKDTQVKLLADKFGYECINSGDMVRELIKTDPAIKATLNAGGLVDDNLVNQLVARRLDNLTPAAKVVSDGYPRRLDQAVWFDNFLAESGRMLDLVIYLRISQTESLKRLAKRGRVDDWKDTILKRLEIFKTETEPVLHYYKKKDLLFELDGHERIEQIHNKIVRLIS